MPRRLVQLFAGLVLYGVSSSMLLLAGLGVDPWDVLHQGLARRTGIPTGTWAIIVGAVVLLLGIRCGNGNAGRPWLRARAQRGYAVAGQVVVGGLAAGHRHDQRQDRPESSGPVPWLQSASVARSMSPSMRFFEPMSRFEPL